MIDKSITVAGVPYNIDAEEAVIGSILIDGECINQVNLSPNDFFSDHLRRIYAVILDMHEAGIGLNEITVSEALKSRKHNLTDNKSQLDDIGGAAYIVHLVSITPTSLDVEHYATIVSRCSFYRALIGYAGQVAGLAQLQNDDTGLSLDKCETMLKELRKEIVMVRRSLELGEPRIIQTSPPRYIWNVNGKDLRLTLTEITNWGRFKNRVISELTFVPIKPRDWDSTINKLLAQSKNIDAPKDASEEQQLKITILKWFERMREGTFYSDLSVGRHVLREVEGESYYCFQSTPLIDYLKKDHKKNMGPQELWVSIAKWGGLKHSFRMKTSSGGSISPNLWCLPLDFCEEKEKINVPTDF